jgi:hypothetical protein
VTTFSEMGYREYGENMLHSYVLNCDIPICVYYENFKPNIVSKNIIYIDIFKSNPDLISFIKRNKKRPVSNFKFDGVRFSYKVFAITNAGMNLSPEWMFWIDADTIFKEKVNPKQMIKKMQDCASLKHSNSIADYDLACFYRRKKPKIPSEKCWTECGLVGYNLRNHNTLNFLKVFRNFYIKDKIYQEKQQHDSWIFDVVRKNLLLTNKINVLNLNPKNYSHPIVQSPMGSLFDHLKGKSRKIRGSSPEKIKDIKL